MYSIPHDTSKARVVISVCGQITIDVSIHEKSQYPVISGRMYNSYRGNFATHHALFLESLIAPKAMEIPMPLIWRQYSDKNGFKTQSRFSSVFSITTSGSITNMWNTAAGSIRHFTLCLLHRRTWQRWQTHRFRGATVSWNSHLCQYMARWVYKKEKLLRANSSEYITSKHAWC